MLRRVIGPVLLTLCMAGYSPAQVSSSTAVVIRAKIRGSITLSMQSTPVYIPVQNGVQQQFEVPLTVQWNLDPRETPGFRVEAYFRNPQSALVEPSEGSSVAAREMLARWGQEPFRRFLPGDGTVTLFRTSVLPNLRRGNESRDLELKISDQAMSNLPDGQYQGVLYLEVKNY